MMHQTTLRKMPPGKRVYVVRIPAHDIPAGASMRHVPEVSDVFADLRYARAFIKANDPRNWGKPQAPILSHTTAGEYLAEKYGC